MRTEEVEREAGSRDEMETGLNPLFLLCFFLLFAFYGKEEEGQVWLLLRKQTQQTTTKGVIV